jgi:hypothetical protein
MANEFRARLPNTPISVLGPLDLGMSLAKGPAKVNVLKPWRRCQDDAAHCDQAAKDFVDDLVSTMQAEGSLSAEAPPLKADTLRFVLRSREDLEALRHNVEASHPNTHLPIVAQPWLDELQMVLVFDLPRATRVAIESDLTQMKLGHDEAFAIARKNTARDLAGGVPRDMGPVRAFTGSVYDASRLVVGTDWAALAKTVKGDLVVAAPGRDLVLFTGTKESFGLDGLRGLADHMKGKSDFPLSSTVLRWTPKGFRVAAAN